MQKKNYGKWGIARLEYLLRNHEGRYKLMKMNNVLIPHLNEIDKQANELWDTLMEQLEKRSTPPPQCTMEWVQWQNGLRYKADEIVMHDIIRID